MREYKCQTCKHNCTGWCELDNDYPTYKCSDYVVLDVDDYCEENNNVEMKKECLNCGNDAYWNGNCFECDECGNTF